MLTSMNKYYHFPLNFHLLNTLLNLSSSFHSYTYIYLFFSRLLSSYATLFKSCIFHSNLILYQHLLVNLLFWLYSTHSTYSIYSSISIYSTYFRCPTYNTSLTCIRCSIWTCCTTCNCCTWTTRTSSSTS